MFVLILDVNFNIEIHFNEAMRVNQFWRNTSQIIWFQKSALDVMFNLIVMNIWLTFSRILCIFYGLFFKWFDWFFCFVFFCVLFRLIFFFRLFFTCWVFFWLRILLLIIILGCLNLYEFNFLKRKKHELYFSQAPKISKNMTLIFVSLKFIPHTSNQVRATRRSSHTNFYI